VGFELRRLRPGSRRKVAAALTWLSRFLGVEEEWVEVRRRVGVRWRRELQQPVLLEESVEELVARVSCCAKLLSPPRFRVFVAFMLATGLRPSEAAYAWRRYWALRRVTGRGAIVLQLNMARTTKHALLALVHPSVDSRVPKRPAIGMTNLRQRWNTICETLHGKRINLYTLRRLHATLLLQSGLKEWEVDLLQGRLEGLTRRHYILYSIDDIWPRYLKALEKPLTEILA
jgi:integrase